LRREIKHFSVRNYSERHPIEIFGWRTELLASSRRPSWRKCADHGFCFFINDVNGMWGEVDNVWSIRHFFIIIIIKKNLLKKKKSHDDDNFFSLFF